jgi:23S rRNA-/tRNA-specific pseudouridylate synthase
LVDYLIKEGERVRLVPPDAPGAMKAVLRYAAIESRDDRTLVSVHLETGRPHQIRIQMANIGHPVVGDMRYGATRELDGRNIALHCLRLGLHHPTRKDWMQWQADPPASWGSRFEASLRHLRDG